MPESAPQDSPGFVHLSVHTEFSLVDSIVRIKPLMQSLDASSPAIALTDQCNLFALVKFYRAALGRGIKPIAGVDARLCNPASEHPYSRAILLVQNDAGYRNLTRLVSRAYQEGQTTIADEPAGSSGRTQASTLPTMQREWLFEHHEGLIVLSGGVEGEPGLACVRGDKEAMQQRVAEWVAVFGDRYYLELQRVDRKGEQDWINAAVALSVQHAIGVVATNNVRFLRREEFPVHEARLCIQSGYVLADDSRPAQCTPEQYLKSAAEMQALFADIPVAVENSVHIARRCNLTVSLGNPVLPDFPIPSGQTEAEYFAATARQGLEERLQKLAVVSDVPLDRPRYEARLQRELDVIIEMDFPGYFLIVADFIRWSRDNSIPVGPGRGSGAGSLVAYALGITDLDPLAYDLLFERFLNPERVSMPDFDIDFCMDGRDAVISYVSQKYGEHRVSQIITYGTMAAKAVVRDVGRVMSQPYGFVDRIAKMVPFEVGMTLDKALAESEDLANAYRHEEEVTELLNMALSLEGLARNAGKHAGGVVIAPTALTDFTPLYCEADGSSLVTQFDKDDAEAVGLVKFDFLGLRTLTIIDNAVSIVNQSADQPLDLLALPLDDRPTYKLLQKAATTAVFQLESPGMKRLIERLKPDNFEDIIALVALYRPGPLQSGMVEDFIDRKHGRKPLAWPHEDYQLESLQPILEPTYGVILYQEQVIQIAQVMAGFSLGRADLLRRAMGKKKPEEMKRQRVGFLEGCEQNAIDPELAGNIFDLVEKFAGYGFNKSHSAAYALLSYQTAWLKCHYPAAFMCAVLSADMDNTDKVVVLIEECAAMGLKVRSPDLNASGIRFNVMDASTIRYGLGAIKGVGEAALAHVLEERDNNGPFKDLDSLCRRADTGSVNKRVLEALVRSGAADGLGPNRASMLAHLPAALQGAEQYHRDQAAGQDDLFGLVAAPEADTAGSSSAVACPVLPEWPERELLRYEKDTLGLYLSGHPISEYLGELDRFTTGRIGPLCQRVAGEQSGGFGGGGDNRRFRPRGLPVLLAGLVLSVRTREGNNGKMGFAMLDDRTGRCDVVLERELLERCGDKLVREEILVVEGDLSVDDFNGGYRIRAREVYDLGDARARFARQLVIAMDATAPLEDSAFEQLLQSLSAHSQGRGSTPVVFDYRNGTARARIHAGNKWRVRPAAELMDALEGVAGAEQVELVY